MNLHSLFFSEWASKRKSYIGYSYTFFCNSTCMLYTAPISIFEGIVSKAAFLSSTNKPKDLYLMWIPDSVMKLNSLCLREFSFTYKNQKIRNGSFKQLKLTIPPAEPFCYLPERIDRAVIFMQMTMDISCNIIHWQYYKLLLPKDD